MSNSDNNIQKRKRDPPFQPMEKSNLIDIIVKHLDIIECKKTDSTSTKAKNAEWAKIAVEFNATSSFMEREWQVLKNLWENLKKKEKSIISQQTQDMFATGGGPPKKFKDDPILERVIDLIRSKVQGFKNAFDNDASHSAHTEDENRENRGESSTQYEGPDDWSNYTQEMLRTPRSAALRETVYFNESDAFVVEELKVASQLQSAPVESLEANQQSTISTSPAVLIEESRTPQTPQVILKSTKHLTSRRRPVLKQGEADLLAQAKIKTLTLTNEQALQQHEVTMKILKLQEEQEKEKLKQEKEKAEQEKIRTELLRRELEKIERAPE